MTSLWNDIITQHNATGPHNYERKSKPACLVLLLPDVGLFLAALRLAVSPSLALDIRSLNVELRSMPASCAAVPMLATSLDITVTQSCCWCSAHSQTTLPLAKWHLTDISQINLAVLFHTCLQCFECLQCFDAVGWAAGRASGL